MTTGIASLRNQDFMTTLSTRVRCLASTAIMPLSLIDTTGTFVHSESRVPTEWKNTTGTVVHLESRVPTEMGEDASTYYTTDDQGFPSQEVLRDGDQSREFKEMRTIQDDEATN
jgi:hypothetical protein